MFLLGVGGWGVDGRVDESNAFQPSVGLAGDVFLETMNS